MATSRRTFLGRGAAALAVVPAGALGRGARPSVRWAARTAADMPPPDLAALLLQRAAFGPRPGDVAAARQMGPHDWIASQLDPAALADPFDDAMLVGRGLTAYGASPAELVGGNIGQSVPHLVSGTLLRQWFSPRQVYEVMVDFWNDHFTVFAGQAGPGQLRIVDDRDVARAHALGAFKAILTASATSPAMLMYLDNDTNQARRINENYAREIMELHTLGVAVDGVPYTEDDIKEVARCFTGWNWVRQGADARGAAGTFQYRDGIHDQNAKRVLGHVVPARQGQQDGRQVIDILCAHDATPRFLATKLVRRFVCDDPAADTPALVDRVAATYRARDGDIGAMVGAILTSAEFAGAFGRFGGRYSRPLDFAARAVRALGATPADFSRLEPLATSRRGRTGAGLLPLAGQLPFYWPTPDGYPDVKVAWASSSGLLARWNFALDLVGSVPRGADGRPSGGAAESPIDVVAQTPPEARTAGAVVDHWIDRILARPMLSADRAVLVDYLTAGGTDGETLTPERRPRIREMVALILDSPYGLWR